MDRCGKLMPRAKELCAMVSGHYGSCRTQLAVKNGRLTTDKWRKLHSDEINRKRQLQGSIIYVMYFVSINMLKIGYATTSQFVFRNRRRANKEFGATDGGYILLQYPGDPRHEKFLQSILAFWYSQPEVRGKLSEWFIVSGQSTDILINQINYILHSLRALIPQND